MNTLLSKRFYYQKLIYVLIISFTLSYLMYGVYDDLFVNIDREKSNQITYKESLDLGYMVIEPPILYSSINESDSQKYAETKNSYLFSDTQINDLKSLEYIDYVDEYNINKFFTSGIELMSINESVAKLAHPSYFSGLKLNLLNGSMPTDYSDEIIISDEVCVDCTLGDRYDGYTISGIYSHNDLINDDYIIAYDGIYTDSYINMLDDYKLQDELPTTLLIKYDVDYEDELFSYVDNNFKDAFVYSPNYNSKLIGFTFAYISNFLKVLIMIFIFIYITLTIYINRLLVSFSRRLSMFNYSKKEIISIVKLEFIIMSLAIYIFSYFYKVIMFKSQSLPLVIVLVTIFNIINIFINVLGVKIAIRK